MQLYRKTGLKLQRLQPSPCWSGVVVTIQLSSSWSAVQVMVVIFLRAVVLWKFGSSSGCPVVVMVSQVPKPRDYIRWCSGGTSPGWAVSQWSDVILGVIGYFGEFLLAWVLTAAHYAAEPLWPIHRDGPLRVGVTLLVLPWRKLSLVKIKRHYSTLNSSSEGDVDGGRTHTLVIPHTVTQDKEQEHF